MYDQNDQQGQAAMPVSDQNPYGQLPVNDGAIGAPLSTSAPVNDQPLAATTTPQATSEDAETDLLGIKQNALQQLNPLVEHLEQTPEEKFKTTMMMIQASDNQKLIKNAYEAAQQITDEKARAQALLDVINEINYFTQQNNG